MKFKVELIENISNKKKLSSFFDDYDEAYNFSNELINQLEIGYSIFLLEKRGENWFQIRTLQIQ